MKFDYILKFTGNKVLRAKKNQRRNITKRYIRLAGVLVDERPPAAVGFPKLNDILVVFEMQLLKLLFH